MKIEWSRFSISRQPMPVDPVVVNDIVRTPFGKMMVLLIYSVNTTTTNTTSTTTAATVSLSEELDQNRFMYTGTLLDWTLANNQSVIYIEISSELST